MRKAVLYGGGVINILLAVFHMFFWSLLDWSTELPKLSALNRGVLQIANVIIIFVILYFAVMSFVMARHERLDVFGRSIIICIAGFYTIRLVLGFPFFGFNYEELGVWIVCLIIIGAYLSVLRMEKR